MSTLHDDYHRLARAEDYEILPYSIQVITKEMRHAYERSPIVKDELVTWAIKLKILCDSNGGWFEQGIARLELAAAFSAKNDYIRAQEELFSAINILEIALPKVRFKFSQKQRNMHYSGIAHWLLGTLFLIQNSSYTSILSHWELSLQIFESLQLNEREKIDHGFYEEICDEMKASIRSLISGNSSSTTP